MYGGRRFPANTGGPIDVVTDTLAIQVKQRKALPGWLMDAWDKAKAGAGERSPLVVLVTNRNGKRVAYELKEVNL